MSRTLNYKQRIADKLAYLESKLKLYGKMSLFDENHAMEDVVCRLLNLVFSYELENLNGQNYDHPAVDLGDKKRGIAVQVTSNSRREKIAYTLEAFDKAGLGDTYHRVVVFILGSQEKYRKGFHCESVEFDPERDIMDFGTLQQRIDTCDPEVLKKVYDYLEQEFPFSDRELGWVKWQIWTKWIGFAMVALLLFLALSKIGVYIYEEYRKSNPKYPHEFNVYQMDLFEAAYFLGSKANCSTSIYTDEPVKDIKDLKNVYYYGNMLKMLYNNLDEHERAITKLTVCVDHVVEDTTPRLEFSSDIVNEAIQLTMQNYGWGETGDIQISLLKITPASNSYVIPNSKFEEPIVLHENAPTSWELNSIKPGETRTVELLKKEDFVLNPDYPDAAYLGYVLTFELYARETNYKRTLKCKINCEEYPLLLAPPEDNLETAYIVWAETSNPEWSRTYQIEEIIPGNKMEQIPVFIIPEKSCTMTLQIRLETLDGETIAAVPLENMKFIIPYYLDKKEYVENMILDWDKICRKIVVFPNDASPYILE